MQMEKNVSFVFTLVFFSMQNNIISSIQAAEAVSMKQCMSNDYHGTH